MAHLCPCGSEQESWWENDARGIPLARVCETCIDTKLSHFRPDVLTNSQYDADDLGDDEPLNARDY